MHRSTNTKYQIRAIKFHLTLLIEPGTTMKEQIIKIYTDFGLPLATATTLATSTIDAINASDLDALRTAGGESSQALLKHQYQQMLLQENVDMVFQAIATTLQSIVTPAAYSPIEAELQEAYKTIISQYAAEEDAYILQDSKIARALASKIVAVINALPNEQQLMDIQEQQYGLRNLIKEQLSVYETQIEAVEDAIDDLVEPAMDTPEIALAMQVDETKAEVRHQLTDELIAEFNRQVLPLKQQMQTLYNQQTVAVIRDIREQTKHDATVDNESLIAKVQAALEPIKQNKDAKIKDACLKIYQSWTQKEKLSLDMTFFDHAYLLWNVSDHAGQLNFLVEQMNTLSMVNAMMATDISNQSEQNIYFNKLYRFYKNIHQKGLLPLLKADLGTLVTEQRGTKQLAREVQAFFNQQPIELYESAISAKSAEAFFETVQESYPEAMRLSRGDSVKLNGFSQDKLSQLQPLVTLMQSREKAAAQQASQTSTTVGNSRFTTFGAAQTVPTNGAEATEAAEYRPSI
jgi:uncharacterized protein (UPF0305 family)